VCAGYQLIGTEFAGEEGQPVAGLEIADLRSGRGDRRAVGEILADADPALGLPELTGFENHQGVTRLGPGVRPLARVATGVGNGDGTEGAHAGRVLGTYLHGPALVRNPALADLLLGWAAGPLPDLPDADEEWGRRLREERLAAVPAGRGSRTGGGSGPAEGASAPAKGPGAGWRFRAGGPNTGRRLHAGWRLSTRAPGRRPR
jgi:CobQ-like glutamine amidotransferase family enzyme